MTLKNFTAGQWSAPGAELESSVCDANDGTPMFVQAASTPEQIDAALACAAATHADNVWGRMPIVERAACLERIATAIEARGAALAEADARLTGVVIGLTSRFGPLCAAAFRQAAELLRHPPALTERQGPFGPVRIERLPLGPAAVIAPWNAPSGIAAHKVASALAAGCPVLLKPSEWAPLSAQTLTEAAAEAGVPPGMWQLLHGAAATGAALVADARVRAVSFTGGLKAGQAVGRACAEGIKPAQLELGGNNPLLILADADLDAAVNGVVAALTTLNGQWCRALGRLLIHRDLVEPVLARVGAKLAQVRLGSSLAPESEMGPLVSKAHRDQVAAQVQHLVAAGGKVHQPTPMPALPGWFYPPTLITGLKPEQTLEEIFGPVATVHAFDDDDEAVRLANQTPFGLAAYVFGAEDHSWAIAEQLRAGLIKLNAVTLFNLHPQAPRPAWGLSGLGDEGTVETFEFFRGTRVIGVAGRRTP